MSTAASILSGVLFASALALFLLGIRRGGLKQELNRTLLRDFRPKEAAAVLLLCLGSLALHMAIASGIRLISGRNDRLIDTFRLYSGLDSRHYLDIARSGYTVTNDAGEILDLVFFPGFPLLAGMLMTVLPEMLSAYLAAWIPFLIAGQVLYRLFRLDYDRVKSLRILLWLCLLPGAVFYSYPMSESLFLAAAAGTVYLARTRRWFAAGVCGFLAAFTRSTGVLLAVPLGIELLEQYAGRYRKDRKQLIRDGACMLMIPLAVCVYLYINYAAEGDPLVFLQYQKSNWHQEAGWFFRTAGEPGQVLGTVGPEPPGGFQFAGPDGLRRKEAADFRRRLVLCVFRRLLRRQLAAERAPVHGSVLARGDPDRGDPDPEGSEGTSPGYRNGGLYDLFRDAVGRLVSLRNTAEQLFGDCVSDGGLI